MLPCCAGRAGGPGGCQRKRWPAGGSAAAWHRHTSGGPHRDGRHLCSRFGCASAQGCTHNSPACSWAFSKRDAHSPRPNKALCGSRQATATQQQVTPRAAAGMHVAIGSAKSLVLAMRRRVRAPSACRRPWQACCRLCQAPISHLRSPEPTRGRRPQHCQEARCPYMPVQAAWHTRRCPESCM